MIMWVMMMIPDDSIDATGNMYSCYGNSMLQHFVHTFIEKNKKEKPDLENCQIRSDFVQFKSTETSLKFKFSLESGQEIH